MGHERYTLTDALVRYSDFFFLEKFIFGYFSYLLREPSWIGPRRKKKHCSVADSAGGEREERGEGERREEGGGVAHSGLVSHFGFIHGAFSRKTPRVDFTHILCSTQRTILVWNTVD